MEYINIHYKNTYAIFQLGKYLSDLNIKNPTIVCIGTDKCIVDSLGPLVGTMLTEKGISKYVYGTLNNPIHAMNINEYVKEIEKQKYENIIAIDASLGVLENIGTIKIKKGPITPGKGLNKLLPPIGNISIIGVVESRNKLISDLIEDVRLSLVYEIADIITTGIIISGMFNELNILDDLDRIKQVI